MDIYTYGMLRMIFFVVWLVVGIVMGNKAKDVGLSFWASFLLTWFLGLIGLAISASMISNKKKENAMQNMFMNQYQNSY